MSYVQTGSTAVEQVSRWFFTELPLLSMLYRLRKYVLKWKGADARYLKMQFNNPPSEDGSLVTQHESVSGERSRIE